MSHASLVKACVDYLNAQGAWAWSQPNRAVYDPKREAWRKFRGRKGVPDVCAVLPSGRFLGVECKTGNDQQTKDQVRFQRECETRNASYVVVRSIDELIEAFSAIK